MPKRVWLVDGSLTAAAPGPVLGLRGLHSLSLPARPSRPGGVLVWAAPRRGCFSQIPARPTPVLWVSAPGLICRLNPRPPRPLRPLRVFSLFCSTALAPSGTSLLLTHGSSSEPTGTFQENRDLRWLLPASSPETRLVPAAEKLFTNSCLLWFKHWGPFLPHWSPGSVWHRQWICEGLCYVGGRFCLPF